MDYNTIFNSLISELETKKGSDIHFGVGRHPVIRVDGQLIFLTAVNVLSSQDIEGLLAIILNQKDLAEFKEKQDLDFSFTTSSGMRVRGNAFIQRGNPAFALRRIPAVVPLSTLGLPEKIRDFALIKQGFFLVVGPMGSGKSTTMSSMVDVINEERAVHIITIEDPVEFLFESKKSIIDQREVGTDTESFETAMKSAFREDANVLLVGEMRTRETIAAAVTAAETGHLVISTLHANSASQTIDRIIDSFPAEQQSQIRLQVASSLVGILSQRLVPKVNGGRVPVCELLVATPAVANLIREKRTHEIPNVIETGMEQGMIDMNRSLLDLIYKGDITFETAMEYTTNPDSLRKQYKM